ncbi:MAG: TonB family protein [Sandaracinaceae bacterium]|nr:TonB family protein [Sandaracinaceae bacterium]
MIRARWWCWVLPLVCGSAAIAAAQEGETPPAPRVTPPTLIEAPEVTVPEGAELLPDDSAVELQITIGADGTVQEARLLAPLRADIDALVLEAAHRMRFEPATRDGQPIPARVRFRYRITPPAPPPSEEPEGTGGETSEGETQEPESGEAGEEGGGHRGRDGGRHGPARRDGARGAAGARRRGAHHAARGGADHGARHLRRAAPRRRDHAGRPAQPLRPRLLPSSAARTSRTPASSSTASRCRSSTTSARGRR